MSIFKKEISVGKNLEHLEPCVLLQVYPLWKTLVCFLKILKTKLPYFSATQLSILQTDICTPMFIVSQKAKDERKKGSISR
jgi:hypothetical protein